MSLTLYMQDLEEQIDTEGLERLQRNINIASMLNDNLISHVDYNWAPPIGGAAATFPSVTKALMDKLHVLFGTTGLASQFHFFHKAMCICIHLQTQGPW